MKYIDIEYLKGKTITKINGGEQDDELTFYLSDGEVVTMYHSQDCCEYVYIESIVGDLDDLIGEPVLVAEAPSSDDEPDPPGDHECTEWTFYKLATRKGYVDIRWFGSSNGYYSTSVTLSCS